MRAAGAFAAVVAAGRALGGALGGMTAVHHFDGWNWGWRMWIERNGMVFGLRLSKTPCRGMEVSADLGMDVINRARSS